MRKQAGRNRREQGIRRTERKSGISKSLTSPGAEDAAGAGENKTEKALGEDL